MMDRFYFGGNEIEQPLYVTDLARSMHIQVLGATGVGKTESSLLPILLSDIISNRSVIFIDPKGDKETVDIIKRLAWHFDRQNDFLHLDLCKPEISTRYNPLKIGTPTELKDKIIGSIIWTEEYYKKVSERILLDIFNFFKAVSSTITLQQLVAYLTNPDEYIFEDVNLREDQTAHLVRLNQEVKSSRKDLSGLISDLRLWTQSEFSEIISLPNSASILEWMVDKKIIYINLNTLAFEESSRRFGRLLIQDIKSAVQRIQGMNMAIRPTTSVIIDEFAAVASAGFIELLNKARSANVRMTLAHQSLGDLISISPSFANQVIDNTNLKIIFRIDNPETSDFYSRLIGTRTSLKETLQTSNDGLLGARKTGMGTTRETEEFIVSPNTLRRLGRGESIILSKIPFSVQKCKHRSIKEWIKLIENKENLRRNIWPNFGKQVYF